MKNLKYLFLIVFLFSFVNKVNAQNTASDFLSTNYEVQFIRTGVDGTILFKIYSYGKTENQAIKNAKSDALKAVMFKGIPGSDLANPMVKDISELGEHKDFFNTFFKTSNYQQYVSISGDGTIDGEDRLKVRRGYKIGIVVSVHKSNLRKLLENEGIIKALNTGF